MRDRMPPVFFALSLVVLALLIIALHQAARPGWKHTQRQYRRLEAQQEPNAAAKDAVLRGRLEIKQVLLPGLQRVDRCTTCHLGVEDPTMKDAPEPFTYHPGLAPHNPAKFGCTVCHGGQGLATDRRNAHGRVAFWSEPLLPRQYVRASCGRCHKEGEVPGVPELVEGRQLFETHGCRGCHKLDGVGGSIGPDLSEEGADKRSPEWLERHFLDPGAVSPNSPMPNFHFTRAQARALTFYMLSLTGQQISSYYLSAAMIPSKAQGRALFAGKDCIACHRLGGVGARDGVELAGVTQRHSAGWLDEQLANPQFVSPGSTMPAYDLQPNARKAIYAFLSSATAEDVKAMLAGRAAPLSRESASIEGGRQSFIRFGCVGCHGTQAEGGLPNPNSQSGQVPALTHVADDYTRDEAANIIRHGRVPPLADPNKPAPPLYMPAWKDMLSDEDINRLLDFIWSLKPKEESSW